MKPSLRGISGVFAGLLALSGSLRSSSVSAQTAAVTAEPAAAPAAVSPAPEASSPASVAAVAPTPAAPATPTATATPATAAPAAVARTPAKPAGHMRFDSGSRPRDSYDGPALLLGRGKKLGVGGYLGMGGAYTRLMDRESGLVSFEAALLLDHRLSLGVAGYGFTRTPRGPAGYDGSPQEFAAGYGGFAVRYSVFGRSPIYATFGLVLGAGAINLHDKHKWHDEDWGDWPNEDGEWHAGRFDPFLFVQPEIALNANATRWLRFGVTGGYRFTNGVGRFGLDNSDLNGVVVGGNIQLGWF
jgi:hypothetical protein